MTSLLKQSVQGFLKYFGKRLTNYHAPTKPYAEGMRFLKGIMQEPAWIIDVGFADGTPDITNVFSMDTHQYLIVEPTPEFKPRLDMLAKAHPDTVHVETCACGEKTGTVSLFSSHTGRHVSRYASGETGERSTVPMETLDNLTDKHDIKGPILLKIDVEGAELDVLNGSAKTLSMCDVVILETWINAKQSDPSRDFATIVAFMKEHGFVIFDFFAGHANAAGVLLQCDAVFVREESPYRHV